MKANISEEVNERFFLALETLIKLGLLKNFSTFFKKNQLHREKYSEMKNNPNSRYKTLDIEAIYYLANKYKVSLEWLILGKGKMLKNEE